MTLYTIQNTMMIGKPIRVYDANGELVPHATECNTETGRVVQFVTDEKGLIISDKKGNAKRETRYHPAPLRVEEIVCHGKNGDTGEK